MDIAQQSAQATGAEAGGFVDRQGFMLRIIERSKYAAGFAIDSVSQWPSAIHETVNRHRAAAAGALGAAAAAGTAAILRHKPEPEPQPLHLKITDTFRRNALQRRR